MTHVMTDVLDTAEVGRPRSDRDEPRLVDPTWLTSAQLRVSYGATPEQAVHEALEVWTDTEVGRRYPAIKRQWDAVGAGIPSSPSPPRSPKSSKRPTDREHQFPAPQDQRDGWSLPERRRAAQAALLLAEQPALCESGSASSSRWTSGSLG